LLERRSDYVADMLCRNDLELFADVLRDLFDVSFVLRWEDDAADAGTMGGEDLFP
jgi:hypothetical protein